MSTFRTIEFVEDKSSLNDKWLLDMSQFLTTGLPPPHMRTYERKRLAVRSRNFCLVGETLYHKGGDGAFTTMKRKSCYKKRIVG